MMVSWFFTTCKSLWREVLNKIPILAIRLCVLGRRLTTVSRYLSTASVDADLARVLVFPFLYTSSGSYSNSVR